MLTLEQARALAAHVAGEMGVPAPREGFAAVPAERLGAYSCDLTNARPGATTFAGWGQAGLRLPALPAGGRRRAGAAPAAGGAAGRRRRGAAADRQHPRRVPAAPAAAGPGPGGRRRPPRRHHGARLADVTACRRGRSAGDALATALGDRRFRLAAVRVAAAREAAGTPRGSTGSTAWTARTTGASARATRPTCPSLRHDDAPRAAGPAGKPLAGGGGHRPRRLGALRPRRRPRLGSSHRGDAHDRSARRRRSTSSTTPAPPSAGPGGRRPARLNGSPVDGVAPRR